MRFRQVHLDFHTSPDIEGIGEKFDKRHWQKTLQEARVIRLLVSKVVITAGVITRPKSARCIRI